MNMNEKTPQFLILVCGAQGSGKSTLADKIKNIIPNSKVFENDMFVYNTANEYEWSPEKAKEAAKKCYREVSKAISEGYSVVVANTFTYAKYRNQYIQLAKNHKIEYFLVQLLGKFNNLHGVPQDKVEITRQNFEAFTSKEKAHAKENGVYSLATSGDVEEFLESLDILIRYQHV